MTPCNCKLVFFFDKSFDKLLKEYIQDRRLDLSQCDRHMFRVLCRLCRYVDSLTIKAFSFFVKQ